MGQDTRKKFMDVIRKWTLHLDGPAEKDCWAPELEKASFDKTTEIQSEKLEAAFRYVYEYSPFYRDKYKKAGLTPSDIKSVEDLHKIPITDKKDLREAIKEKPPWGTFSCVDDELWKKDGWIVWQTTGSTGDPIPCRFTHFDRVTQGWLAARHMYMSGFRSSDFVMYTSPYITHMFAWAHYNGQNYAKIPMIAAGPPMPTEARIGTIMRYKPNVIFGTPTYMIHLGEIMREKGIDPKSIPIRQILVGGEPGGSIYPTKKRLMELWGANVCDGWGTTEVGPFGGHAHTCSYEVKDNGRNSYLHYTEDAGIPEVLDTKTLDPVTDGENGTLIWSNVSSVSQPILRFNMNDVVNIQSMDCPCGRTHRMSKGGVQGRADDMIFLRGVNVFPANVEEGVRSLDGFGNEYRLKLVNDKNGNTDIIVEAEIIPSVPVEQHEGLIKELQAKIRSKCEVTLRIDTVPYGSLPRAEFKSTRILDLRKK